MSCWHVLELPDQSNNEQIPQLLVKPHFGSDAYTIFLTDLNNIWSEELNLSSIVDRASVEASPIEVSKQDTTQLAILLENVQKSLAGKDDTSCRMTWTDGDGLILHTTVRLPEPLDSLRWKFYLRKRAPVVLKNELILPLLVSSHIQHGRVNDLIGNILDKDRAITRLIDQFESSNLDLAAAFPSIGGLKSGRQLVKREQAAKHVPGLQAFDETSWKRKTCDLHDADISTLGLFQEALLECAPKVPPRLKSDDESDMWWTAIGSALKKPRLAPRSKRKVASKKQEPPKATATGSETDEDETEDEFETHENFKLRATTKPTEYVPVPAAVSAAKPRKEDNLMEDDNDDDDEDDLDVPPKSQSQSRTPRAPTRKAKSPTPAPSPPPEERVSLVPKTKANVFRIGGRAMKAERSPTAPEDAPESGNVSDELPTRSKADVSEIATAPKAAKKSFKIGGKIKAPSDSGAKKLATVPAENSSAVTAANSNKHAPAPKNEDVQMEFAEETSEEKAERKRRELKRRNDELAMKQAQSKKKRRF